MCDEKIRSEEEKRNMSIKQLTKEGLLKALERIYGTEDMPNLIFYAQTDSTNTRARELAASEKRTTVLIAALQSAGRGRRGRSFLSDEGGIYVSFLVFPDSAVGGVPAAVEAGKLTHLTALTAAVSLEPIERACGVTAGIKWVNDIYVNGKKIAGILTEGEFDEQGKIKYYVVGMGINVYKNADLTQNVPIASTLEDHAQKDIDINSLAADVIYAFLCGKVDAEGCLALYRERSTVIGREVRVLSEPEYDALCVGITDDYALLVKDREGKIHTLNSGEVSVRPNQA